MLKIKYIFFSVFILLLLACQNQPKIRKQPVQIEFDQKAEFDFIGRGSMAAMMMSGSMGAMGIAIGVAIDQGLAKDITTSIKKAGFDKQQLVNMAFSQTPFIIDAKSCCQKIVFTKLGFKAKGDLITPWVEVDLISNKSTVTQTYEQLLDDKRVAAELSMLKEDGQLAHKMLVDAMVDVINAL